MLTKSIPLRIKINALEFALIISIFVLVMTGIYSINQLLNAANLNQSVRLIQSHMQTDMDHDAISSNVNSLLIAISSNNTEAIKNYKESLNEYAEKIQTHHAQAKNLAHDSTIKSMLEEITPYISEYSSKTLNLIQKIESANKKSMDSIFQTYNSEFIKMFENLEERLGKISDYINNWADNLSVKAQTDANIGTYSLWITGGVSLLLGIALALYNHFSLFKPLLNLLNITHPLLTGSLGERVPYQNRTDEIGDIAACFEKLRIHTQEINKLKHMIDEMPINVMIADPQDNFKIIYSNRSNRESLRRLKGETPLKIDQLETSTLDQFSDNPQSLHHTLSESRQLPQQQRIKIGSETIDQKISPIYDENQKYIGVLMAWVFATKNDQLAQDFERSIGTISSEINLSAGSLEQRAVSLQTAIGELSNAAREISERIHASLFVVQDAVSRGDDAREQMSKLSSSTDKISSVVTLIRSIAEKTNLLALNASIESARAGEVGKGFAVVANEVKALATQTSKAIIDINDQVQHVQQSTNSTLNMVKEMCDTIQTVNMIATDIANAVEQQRASTSEISRVIGKSNEQDDCSYSSISAMAFQLKTASNILSDECNEFIQKVHKA